MPGVLGTLHEIPLDVPAAAIGYHARTTCAEPLPDAIAIEAAPRPAWDPIDRAAE